MNGYHPDWVGALICGAGIGVALVIATRIWPQRDRRKRVMLIPAVIAVALAIIARAVMRRFGI
jgi:hypothetical protein